MHNTTKLYIDILSTNYISTYIPIYLATYLYTYLPTYLHIYLSLIDPKYFLNPTLNQEEFRYYLPTPR